MRKKSICAVLIFSVILAACGAKPNGEEALVPEISVPVGTMVASKDSIKREMVYAGQISPSQSVSVTSKMAGKVLETHFEVGDKVKEGDVLFTLDRRDIENQIKQLQSQLQVSKQGVVTARNSVETVTGGQYESQITQLETTIENAKKQVENAELALSSAETALNSAEDNYNRIKQLYDSGVVSKAEYDNAELTLNQRRTAYDQAKVGVSSAQLSLTQAESSLQISSGKIVEENTTKAELGVEQAAISASSVQTQIDIARSTLQDLTIKAPMDGVVATKQIKAFEMASPQVAAYTIVDIDSVIAKVKVSEKIINKIALGQTIDVYINALSDQPFVGNVTSISPVADQTSTFPIEISIPNPNGDIKAGMFAETRFLYEQSQDTIVLPRNAVLEDEIERYVYINDGEYAKRTAVTTGIDNGEYIEILSGINLNDEVVTKGQTLIRNGDKINIVSDTGNREE